MSSNILKPYKCSNILLFSFNPSKKLEMLYNFFVFHKPSLVLTFSNCIGLRLEGQRHNNEVSKRFSTTFAGHISNNQNRLISFLHILLGMNE